MKRYARPIAISGGESEVVDLLSGNYSARRVDTRHIVSMAAYDYEETELSLPELMRFSDFIATDYDVKNKSDVLLQASEAGVKLHLSLPMDSSGDEVFRSARAIKAFSISATNTVDNQQIKDAGYFVFGNMEYDSGDHIFTEGANIVVIGALPEMTLEESEAIVAATPSTVGRVIVSTPMDYPSKVLPQAMALNADALLVDYNSRNLEIYPKLYLGERLLGVNADGNDVVFTTDIGTVRTDLNGNKWIVENHLATIVGHGIDGTGNITYLTADSPEKIVAPGNIPYPYSNDVELQRYVKFFTDGGDIILRYFVSADSDTIVYQATRDIVDPLPEWTVWRTNDNSLAFKLTNIAGAEVSAFENAIAEVRMALIQRFPVEDVHGTCYTSFVGKNYFPPIPMNDVYGNLVVQAANENELMFSSVPAFLVTDDGVAIFVGNQGKENLWTPLDEWGLLLDLKRHTGEHLARYQNRLQDIFKHPVGSTRQGLIAAAIRELQPFNGPTETSFTTIE